MGIPNFDGKDIKEIVHYLGYVLLWIWGMKFTMCIIREIFPKNCKWCGKKASGTP